MLYQSLHYRMCNLILGKGMPVFDDVFFKKKCFEFFSSISSNIIEKGMPRFIVPCGTSAHPQISQDPKTLFQFDSQVRSSSLLELPWLTSFMLKIDRYRKLKI